MMQFKLQDDYEVINDKLKEKLEYDLSYNFARGELSIMKVGTVVSIIIGDDVLELQKGKSIGQNLWKLKYDLQIQSCAAYAIADANIIYAERLQRFLQPDFEQTTRDFLQYINEQRTEFFSQRDKTKRTHIDVNFHTINVTSSKELFEQFKWKFAQFESTEDELNDKKLIETLEDLIGQKDNSFNPLNYQISSVERQVLFDKVSWKCSNKIWKVPDMEPLAEGE
ncbi:MAG: hypothetical protein EZS28_028114 [Streblomastix strix]|uniref:Uncharacterized protein n=1 Tax=Streblomastix strix TaxID=222440 RepID=A0A5J4V1U1_9EUKA|nr:MAG: hypothetical protein EZS28_028114 [Streblomastix strix]